VLWKAGLSMMSAAEQAAAADAGRGADRTTGSVALRPARLSAGVRQDEIVEDSRQSLGSHLCLSAALCSCQ
jgi:hypothetical protein